jgi:putative transposase
MDIQDSSLHELKQSNKERSTAKREHSNYSAAIALDKRQKLESERKQSKKERQQTGQKELRGKSKQNSNVVELRKVRAGKSARNKEPMELLPERVTPEQMKPQPLIALPPTPILEPAASTPRTTEGCREESIVGKLSRRGYKAGFMC